MIRLPNQSDDKLALQFGSFDRTASSIASASRSFPRFNVNRCAIRGVSGGVGFWTGLLGEYVSFLALKPVNYGDIAGFEAFRAWTDPDWRRKGLAAELLTCAARQVGPIISDREGMTPGAFDLWQKLGQSGAVVLDYLDVKNHSVVPLHLIPPDDLFSRWANAGRWQMLLRPVT